MHETHANAETYYDLLEITEDAGQEEVKRAFRRLAMAYHPDRIPSHLDRVREHAAAMMASINEAYAVLSDPQRRSAYDRELQRSRGGRKEWEEGERDGWSPAQDFEHRPYAAEATDPEDSVAMALVRFAMLLGSELMLRGGGMLLWAAASLAGAHASMFVMGAVTPWSLVWCLALLLFLLCVPGLIVGVQILIALLLTSLLILGLLWVVTSLVTHFWANPW